MLRGGQIIQADTRSMYLSADEKRIETVELHGQARITTAEVRRAACRR